MNLKCCIIDDEPLAVELLASYVRQTPFLTLEATFSNALQAVERIMKGDIDIVYCDIQMPKLNGLDFSRMVENRTFVIFTTAFEQYAVDSYTVNAVDYLLKPISYAQFLRATQKVLRLIDAQTRLQHNEQNDFMYVKSEYKLRQILFAKILYIEGLKDYVKIYVENEPSPILSLLSLKSLEDILPADRFMRVHRSFIVHLCKIDTIDRNRIVFGDRYIPIGDTYKTAVSDFIDKHLPPRVTIDNQ